MEKEGEGKVLCSSLAKILASFLSLSFTIPDDTASKPIWNWNIAGRSNSKRDKVMYSSALLRYLTNYEVINMTYQQKWVGIPILNFSFRLGSKLVITVAKG